MRSFLLSCALGCAAIGAGALVAIGVDATGQQKLSAEQMGNLAMVALFLPHAGAGCALAASKA